MAEANSFSYELRLLRSKLGRLLESLNAMRCSPVPTEQWPFWLEKFNAIVNQYNSLNKDLSLALEAAVVEPILAEGSTDSLPTIFLRSKLAPEVEEANQGETLSLPEVKEDVKRLSRIVEIFSEAREAFEADLKASRKESSRPSEDAVLLESTIKIMTSGKL